MPTPEQARVILVLERMLAMAKKDPDDAAAFTDMLEAGLSDLHECDFFGTEGQCDPRGDFRDGTWSMHDVQGA